MNTSEADTSSGRKSTNGQTTTGASAAVYEVLIDGIVRGAYPPGSRLPEEDIAATVGVSRTPVREALNRLQAEGLVKTLRNRGSVVVGWTAEELDDIFELRVMLEGYGARRAADRSSAEVSRLYEICDETDELLSQGLESNRNALSKLALQFHSELHQIGGNRQLVTILPMLLTVPMVTEAFRHHSDRDLERAYAAHREIVEAIQAADGGWAESIMRAHLRAGRRSLKSMEWHSS